MKMVLAQEITLATGSTVTTKRYILTVKYETKCFLESIWTSTNSPRSLLLTKKTTLSAQSCNLKLTKPLWLVFSIYKLVFTTTYEHFLSFGYYYWLLVYSWTHWMNYTARNGGGFIHIFIRLCDWLLRIFIV